MKVMYVSLVCLLSTVHQGFAVPEGIPPDVFKAQRDGYLYADYPGVFDAGITIEAWIYLTKRPADREHDSVRYGQWLIVSKPPSYVLTIAGRSRSSGIDMSRPRGTTWVRFEIHKNKRESSSAGIDIKPEEYPLRRWVHVGIQLSSAKNGVPNTWFFDGRLWNGYGKEMNRYQSLNGYIDVVRVSEGVRYATRRFSPRRHFRADARTIALWQFKEGPGSDIHRDSSGNDYHLFPGGSLAVDSRGKLATTWGSLKR